MATQNAIAIMKRDEYPLEVRRMAQDIKDLLPNGNKLADFEALALAHSAHALKLNPFTGEIWYIPGHGLMAGIKGHRRTAHEQIEKSGGSASNYWPEFDLMTPEQKKQYLIPDNALGFICRLYDTVTLRTYSETVERLYKAGAPWADIKHIIGDRPYTIGVGFYMSGEQTRMKPHQCGMKRAEADALKRRFDLPFEGGAGTINDADTDNGNKNEIMGGEFIITTDDQARLSEAAKHSESAEQIEQRMQAASKSLRGDQGDLGVDWSTVPEPTEPTGNGNGKTAAELTAPAPEPPKKSEAVKSAVLRYQPFVKWANDWVQGKGKSYSRNDSPAQADMWHLLKRIGILGFREVTAENADDIKAALESYVHGKVDAEQAIMEKQDDEALRQRNEA